MRKKNPIGRINGLILAVVVFALFITIFLGGNGLSAPKICGAATSLLLIVPVWLLLLLKSDSPNPIRFLVLFLGGFAYKLAGLIIAVVWVVRYSSWNHSDFLIGLVPLLIALQLSESLSFWDKRSVSSDKTS